MAVNDVFISYAREDAARAERIAGGLEAAGWEIFWDREILAGQSFGQAIRAALDQAKCLVVLWSEASVLSDWVKDEASAGKERGILVPVRIDDVPIPLGFGQVHTADLLDWDGEADDPAFAALTTAVRAVVAEERALPPGPRPDEPGGRERGLARLAMRLGVPVGGLFAIAGIIVVAALVGGVALLGGGSAPATTIPVTTVPSVAQPTATTGATVASSEAPTAEPAVPAEGLDCTGLSYCEDFRTIENGWPTVVEDGFLAAYHPETYYHVEADSTDAMTYIIAGTDVADGRIETLAHIEFTKEENPFAGGDYFAGWTEGTFRYGLVLRATDDGRFLTFTVQPLTTCKCLGWLFRDFDPAEFTERDLDPELAGFQPAGDRAFVRRLVGSVLEGRPAGLNPGFTKIAEGFVSQADFAEPVTLGVIALGSSFELLIDGIRVDLVNAPQAAPSGDIGLYVETRPGEEVVHIHFDSLTVADPAA